MKTLSSCLVASVVALALALPDILANPKIDGVEVTVGAPVAEPPLPTTDLVVNLSADGTLYSTGTTPANDTEAVETWVDAQSGFDVTSAGTDRPNWFADDGNGNPYVEFDGDDIAVYSAGNPTTGSDVTFHAVLSTDNIALVQQVVNIYDVSSTNHRIFLGLTTNPANGTVFMQEKDGSTTATARSVTTVGAGTVYIISGTINAADNERKVYINGVLSHTESTALTYDHTVADDYSIGASLSNGTEDGNLDGNLYQALIYDGLQSPEDFAATIAFLQNKWAASLP